MGSGRWEADKWNTYSTAHVSSKATVDHIYTSRSLVNELDPKGVKIRESCDSVDNPESTAVIVGLDVTGSMSSVLEAMARTGLSTLATEVYDRKPISDPHLMFMGIGDVAMGDSAPLQVTQFEADIRIAEQLTKLYLEKGGGGNNSESYTLPWYFAGMHTRIDCFEKHGRKGFIFTVGDEQPNQILTASQIEKVMGYKPEKSEYTAKELLTIASRSYEVFHLMVSEGSHMDGSSRDTTIREWKDLLGERAILLTDHKKMGEVITSILEVMGGKDKASVVASWDGSTSLVVSQALDTLTPSTNASVGGVVSFT